MENAVKDFLKTFCKCDEDSNINYKPYEHGAFVESISFSDAVRKFMSDFEDMVSFLSDYGISDNMKIFETTCNMWKKHLVVY